MNKIFLTAVLFLGLSITAFGQEKTKTALTKGKAEILKGKESGSFSFTLPSGTATSTVEQNAKAYTMYFKVNFNESTHEAAITMVHNDEKSRHVICRFLMSSGMEKVNIDGKDLTVEEFFINYLK
jgi:hypothetical protein